MNSYESFKIKHIMRNFLDLNKKIFRKFFLSTLAIFFLGTVQLAAQGIEFFQGTWDEALAKAKEERKPIFVDAYAVWCGPCKRMAKQVFTDKKVGDFYNASFVNMKLDMEKGEGLKFRKKYPVSAFPTLYYIDAGGEVLHKLKGAQQIEDFLKLGLMVLKKVDHSKDFVAEYEKGNREPAFIYEYIKALNESNKPSLKIANKYLNKKTNLKDPTNLKIVFEATTQADSKIFDMLVANKRSIEGLFSKEAVALKIEKACQATAAKSIEFESEDLLEEAQAKYKKHLPKKAAIFALQTDMEFCVAMGNAQKYVKCCSDYVKKEVKNDDKRLHGLAQQIAKNFSKDNKAMKQAEKLAKKALEQDASILDYYLTYASILHQNGKKSEALKVANNSMPIAAKTGSEKYVRRLIENIEG